MHVLARVETVVHHHIYLFFYIFIQIKISFMSSHCESQRTDKDGTN